MTTSVPSAKGSNSSKPQEMQYTMTPLSAMLAELSGGLMLPPALVRAAQSLPRSHHQTAPCREEYTDGLREVHPPLPAVASQSVPGSQNQQTPISVNSSWDQQQSFSNQGRKQMDPFEEFVLFDQPKAAQIRAADLPMIQESEHYFTSHCTWLGNHQARRQPEIQMDRSDVFFSGVELIQSSRSDANMPTVGKSSPSCSTAFDGMNNAMHIADNAMDVAPRITADLIHANFPDTVPDVQQMPSRGPDVQLMPTRSTTDPTHLSLPPGLVCSQPRSNTCLDGSHKVPVAPSRSPPMPTFADLSNDAPLRPPRSQICTDTVPNMLQMPPRNHANATFNPAESQSITKIATSVLPGCPEDMPVIPPKSWTHLPASSCQGILKSEFFGGLASLDNASKVQMMPRRSLTDPEIPSCPDRGPDTVPSHPPRSQTGSTHVPFDAPRSLSGLSNQTSLSFQDVFPSIEDLVARTRQLLQQAEETCDRPRQESTPKISLAPSSFLMPEAPALDSRADISLVAMDDMDDASESADSGSDYDVLVGPTELLSAGLGLRNLALPAGGKSKKWVPLKSCPGFVALTDGIRLARAQSFAKPLSFGSTLHLMGQPIEMCRPCMFEQRPGRCKKSFCCDFCHVGHHRPQARKAKTAALAKEKQEARKKWATT